MAETRKKSDKVNMDDEIKENEGAPGKEAKPKEGKIVPIDPTQAEKPPKKKRGGLLRVILFLVFLLALAAFCFLLVRDDLLGLRTSFLLAVNQMDPNTEYAMMQQRELDVKAREVAVAKLEAGLAAEQERLDDYAAELSSYAAELERRDGLIGQREEDAVPVFRRNLSENDLADMKALGKLYGAMEPASAAEIMSSLYSTGDMASIIYYMSPASAAKIMEALRAETAARITEILLDR